MDETGTSLQTQESQSEEVSQDARVEMYMTFKSGDQYFGLKVRFVGRYSM